MKLLIREIKYWGMSSRYNEYGWTLVVFVWCVIILRTSIGQRPYFDSDLHFNARSGLFKLLSFGQSVTNEGFYLISISNTFIRHANLQFQSSANAHDLCDIPSLNSHCNISWILPALISSLNLINICNTCIYFVECKARYPEMLNEPFLKNKRTYFCVFQS